MAATAWKVHDKALLKILNGTIDIDNDALVMRLFTSTSNVQTTSVSDATALTGELATANGYTSGGKAVTGAALTEAGGVTKFDCNDEVWTAAGGSITARKAAIIDTSATPNEVLCSCSLDTVDVVATDTNTLTVAINAGGVFTVANL